MICRSSSEIESVFWNIVNRSGSFGGGSRKWSSLTLIPDFAET